MPSICLPLWQKDNFVTSSKIFRKSRSVQTGNVQSLEKSRKVSVSAARPREESYWRTSKMLFLLKAIFHLKGKRLITSVKRKFGNILFERSSRKNLEESLEANLQEALSA